VGVEQGISDLPWHKDCALGLHSYRCPSVTCGISVTPSAPDNGQLGVVAGSHRVNIPLFDLGESIDLPEVFLTTERGDVTVHLSCALHCATAPQHSERRVSYSSFVLPGSDTDLEDKIRAVRDQAGRDTYAPA
jgi:ectoine hydroxylase-related dioxygenase (phytanoyl-CoA dioxygenase family)